MTHRPLRICLISEEYPPETGWGGIGTYSYNLARGLADSGHRVHVIARCWGEPRVDVADGVSVHRIPIPEPTWRRGTWFVNVRFPMSREVILWSLQVRRAIDAIQARERLDVVESPEYHAQALAASLSMNGTRLVVRLHTPSFLCREVNRVWFGGSRWDTLLSEQAERWAAQRAHLLTSPSQALARDVARRWRLSAGAISVIPNPIDDDLFRPPVSLPSGPLVLFVGRLERRKGVQTLMDAWPLVCAAVPQARLQLVGNDHASAPDGGSMRAYLHARLKQSGATESPVHFAGAVQREHLPGIYCASQVCVVPSLYENFPYTCLEAMACGCAVVASRVGGIPEIVTDGVDGLLVEPGDVPALASAIERVLSDHDLRHCLGQQARMTVERRFGREAVTAQTLRVYRDLLATRRGPAWPAEPLSVTALEVPH